MSRLGTDVGIGVGDISMVGIVPSKIRHLFGPYRDGVPENINVTTEELYEGVLGVNWSKESRTSGAEFVPEESVGSDFSRRRRRH